MQERHAAGQKIRQGAVVEKPGRDFCGRNEKRHARMDRQHGCICRSRKEDEAVVGAEKACKIKRRFGSLRSIRGKIKQIFLGVPFIEARRRENAAAVPDIVPEQFFVQDGLGAGVNEKAPSVAVRIAPGEGEDGRRITTTPGTMVRILTTPPGTMVSAQRGSLFGRADVAGGKQAAGIRIKARKALPDCIGETVFYVKSSAHNHSIAKIML